MNMISTQLRQLTPEELLLVSGGTDTIVVTGSRYSDDDWFDRWNYYNDYYNSDNYYDEYGGGGGYDASTTDTDGDGTPDAEDEIVVTATPMTPEQRAAYDYHRDVATWTVNAIYYGLLARLGYAGYAGAAGAAGAVSSQALSDAREQMIDNAADLNYRRDGADGVYDGDFDAGYITGDKELP
jgi:hypothetical protein